MNNLDSSAIPNARVDGLDIDEDADELEWERRAMALAAERIRAARERLERLGIVDADGTLVSRVLPPDMEPASETTVETG